MSSPQQYYGPRRTSGSTSALPRPYPIFKPASPQFPRGEVPEFDALYWDTLQREWRTPPLWGVADTAPYLHDGRAETLDEAILWHGGEAESSRNLYSDLSRESKDAVLAFLSSLRAPRDQDGSIARVKVWIFPEEVKLEQWAPAKPEHRLSKNIRDLEGASMKAHTTSGSPWEVLGQSRLG